MSETRGRPKHAGRGNGGQGPKVAILATVAVVALLFVLAPRGGRERPEPNASVETPAAAHAEALEPGGTFPVLEEPIADFSYELPASPLPEEPGDSTVAGQTL